MTIALQHDFRILLVENTQLTVDLFFNPRRENITIPFDAIRVFSDPPIGFAIARNASDEW